MKKKSKAAPLTSNLMARKGDQVTARSGSASGKLGVSEMQDEIVARLAEEVTRGAGISFAPVQSAAVQSATIRMDGMDLSDSAPPRPRLPSPEPPSPHAALGPISRQAPSARRLPVSRKPAALSDRSAFFNAGDLGSEDEGLNEAPRTKPSAILGSVFEVNFGRADLPESLNHETATPAPVSALGPVDAKALNPEAIDERGASEIVLPSQPAERAMLPQTLDVDLSRTGTLADERTVPGGTEPRSNSFPFMLLFILTVAISGAVGVWLTRGDEKPFQAQNVASSLTSPPPDLSATRPEMRVPAPAAEVTPPKPITKPVPAPEATIKGVAADPLPAKPVGKVETKLLEPAAAAPAVVPKPAPPFTQPPAPKSEEALAESVDTAPKLSGYSAQLMSAKRKSVSESEWIRLSGAYPTVLGSQPHAVVAGEVPNKGTYHRLRVGEFESIRDVQRFCAELDALNLACLVVKN